MISQCILYYFIPRNLAQRSIRAIKTLQNTIAGTPIARDPKEQTQRPSMQLGLPSKQDLRRSAPSSNQRVENGGRVHISHAQLGCPFTPQRANRTIIIGSKTLRMRRMQTRLALSAAVMSWRGLLARVTMCFAIGLRDFCSISMQVVMWS
jgi:hypothetical protein